MKYMHKATGSIDDAEGWIGSYQSDELDERGLTAEQAFYADIGVTLFATPDAIDISTAAATLGRKGGSVKSPRKAATSAANGSKGGAPTKAERAERIEYYRKLEEAGHKNRVRRYEPVDMSFYPVAIRAALSGRKVRICEQDYLAPMDPIRAERGLVAGLANRTRRWMEIDGVRLGSDRPTAEEISGSLSGTV